MSRDAILAKMLAAEQMLASGDVEGAIAIAQRLISKAPGDPGLNSLLAVSLLRKGTLPQAEFYAKRALQAEPANVDLLINLSMVLTAKRDQAGAMAVLERAVASNPTSHKARLALANALMDAHDSPGAISHLKAALANGPDAQVETSLAGALLNLGMIDEAAAFSREALTRHPDEPALAAGYPNALTYKYGVDPDELARAHRAYGETVRRIRPKSQVVAPPRATNPAKRLRVAIISPDLRQHSVSFFAEPLFEHRDRAQFELLAYCNTRTPDATTARLRALADGWAETANLSDIMLAQRLRADEIDIGVDLAGHTLGNNLLAFSLRPAPVQVTYCGYPDTTGLAEMDYRIVDSLTDPPTPEVDARATEKLWRLDPCFLCYRPNAESPEPWRDSAHPGPVFGSFNASRKINAGLIGIWSRLLQALPGSRLILKSFDFASKGAAERIRAEFAARDIGEDRLTFMAATKSYAEHLALYSRMDVALDAFPYHGTTTTCEALWMGVPVVTLAGNTHAGRVGVSLLTNVGVPELIAHSEDEYVSLAARLATDAARLGAYRSGLRAKIAASPLCDPRAFAARWWGALREMWAQACERDAKGPTA
ncbi:MAG: tetratricopeptide repeat protein [Tepidisphaera sp.]|nr:tetratricopeptide repeat protein [Tepidisphaera sp.]